MFLSGGTLGRQLQLYKGKMFILTAVVQNGTEHFLSSTPNKLAAGYALPADWNSKLPGRVGIFCHLSASDMGIPCGDDVVLIQMSKRPDEPSVITVNCPDKAGLGCDLSRIILEFGLRITKGDFSKDGRWCYVVLWVVPHDSSLKVDWESLKTRLLSVCPSYLFSYYFNQQSNHPSPSPVYLLKIWCLDQTGSLHDVTKVLCKLELTIQRVKVMPTPDGKVLDLFFITDGMELLETKKRRDDVCEHLMAVLGNNFITSELQLAGPEYKQLEGLSSLPPAVAEELFSYKLSNGDISVLQALCPDMSTAEKATITVDNSLSPLHTLLQVRCVDQKGLVYDIMRTSKDFDIQTTYGRLSSSVKGFRNIDLFIQQNEKKILDPDSQTALCSRLKEEMLHPLRVIIANRGPDIELLVANPVESSGKGRPRVFYDVTFTLKALGVCIFSAEIVRHSTSDRQWEVYRFLLNETHEFPLASNRARIQIVDKVRKTLMGW
ncbi:ACT domain-containing protein ACR9-like [Juglans microcarpa x Juglans regia]|uniref:ACT domain-containing protein ACR9-like n=1 Tax=Juglans microcarpa x Juglans regia TaxID=2249226 RepID=UPI001B7D9A20|nr:ACT domain-containing protein ACR9-like [Juglans microcarpa x Juglans regia]